MITCGTHAGVPAAWQCNVCHLMLCPDCAERRPIFSAEDAIVCVPCGGPARVLTKPKRIAPYWESFRIFGRNMVSREGLLQLVAVGAMIYLTSLLPGWVGFALSRFVFVGYFFQVVALAAQGSEELPLPSDFLGVESLVVIGRYGFATTLIWGPAVVYALWGVSFFELTNNTTYVLKERLLQPEVLLMVLAGVCYYPAAIIAGAIAESTLAMINPLITLRLIARIPGQYFLTVAVWGALTVAGFFWELLVGSWASTIPIAFLAPMAGEVLKLPPHLLVAFVLGRLVFQNAEHFGVVKDEWLVEPLVPDAEPRGRRPRPLSRSP